VLDAAQKTIYFEVETPAISKAFRGITGNTLSDGHSADLRMWQQLRYSVLILLNPILWLFNQRATAGEVDWLSISAHNSASAWRILSWAAIIGRPGSQNGNSGVEFA
jgi:hypothetical protein